MIPVSLLGAHAATDYFVLYTEFTHGSDGFEEWKFFDAPSTVPAPTSLAMVASGLIAAAWASARRRRRR